MGREQAVHRSATASVGYSEFWGALLCRRLEFSVAWRAVQLLDDSAGHFVGVLGHRSVLQLGDEPFRR